LPIEPPAPLLVLDDVLPGMLPVELPLAAPLVEPVAPCVVLPVFVMSRIWLLAPSQHLPWFAAEGVVVVVVEV
jgi:hypothetical protein